MPRAAASRHLTLVRRGKAASNGLGPGLAVVEVVGESHHQATLEELAGGKARESQAILTNAELWREPDNPFDLNAIQVLIGGRLVGHLPRADAARYAAVLDAAGILAVPCPAEIRGGWKTPWEEGHFGVVVWLPPPAALLGP